MHDSVPTDTTLAPWQRFSLFDLLLLFVPVAVAFSLVKLLGPLPLPAAVVFASALGALLVTPVVLAGHYFRGRRVWPSIGEWTPIWTLGLLGLMWFVGEDGGEKGSPTHVQMLILLLMALFLVWIIGNCVLVARFFPGGLTTPCSWTDAVGTAVVALGGWVYIALIAWASYNGRF